MYFVSRKGLLFLSSFPERTVFSKRRKVRNEAAVGWIIMCKHVDRPNYVTRRKGVKVCNSWLLQRYVQKVVPISFFHAKPLFIYCHANPYWLMHKIARSLSLFLEIPFAQPSAILTGGDSADISSLLWTISSSNIQTEEIQLELCMCLWSQY
jgi:hypothetical protein